MKIKNLILLPLLAATLSSCDLPFGPGGGGDEKADPTLYQLKLSSNLASVSQDSLKATFAYGVEGKEVKEGVRDADEIAELKKAGATDADIAKAGKRQSDGSYYFFEADPMYLESPNSNGGYKYMGWYDKDENKYIYNQYMTGNDGNIPRWNMYQKNANLEAHYEKWTYHYYFNSMMEDCDTNPNAEGNYCAVDNGVVTLLPATTTSTNKKFIGWEYEDTLHTDAQGYSTWVLLEDNKLPVEYYEENMRISPRWEYEQATISFEFELYIDPETSQPLEYDDVITSMTAHGNLTTIDGVKEPCEPQSYGTPVNKNSVIKMQMGSWLDLFYSLNPDYEVFYFMLNGERNNFIDAKHMNPPYISISDDTVLEKETVITFVVSEVVAD